MHKTQLRIHAAKFIVFTDLALIALIGVLALTPLLPSADLVSILKVIVPIKTIYFTAIIRHAIQHQSISETPMEGTNELSPLYVLVARFALYGHALMILVSIVLFVLNLVGSVENLLTIISVVESIFGLYLGLIWADLFDHSKE